MVQLILRLRQYKKWRVRVDDTCLCGEGAETFLHLQLECKLTSRRGPSMDADFEKWQLVMQNKWRKMADRRGQTRGEEHQGQRPSRLLGMTEEIERKRKEAAARQTAAGERKH